MSIDTIQEVAIKQIVSKHRILVVEDDASLGIKFKRIVEQTGAVVDLAPSRGEALKQVENHRYDVALVDIMLSNDPLDRGGLAVIERIREMGALTSVVVVSATNDVSASVRAFRVGAFDYLIKKDLRSSDEILATIERALEASSRDVRYAKVARQARSTLSSTEGSTWLPNDNNAVRERFEHLASLWERESAHISSPAEMALLPSYQEIIGMGPAAIPLILERLSLRANHWFWALRSITGTNPVSAENIGRIDKMTEDWLCWGRKNGIIQ